MKFGPTSEWIAAIAGEAGEAQRRALFERHAEFHTAETVTLLQGEVSRQAYSDKESAQRLAGVAGWLAEKLGDATSRATGERCLGHVRYVESRYEEALGHYERALGLLEGSGRALDAARTMASGLQCLIYLDRYEQALEWAKKAEEIFRAEGDELRLARLWSNVGNIHYRQDRHEEALRLYRQAHAVLIRLGEPKDVAAVLSNMAVCSISVGEFRRALVYYRRARGFSEKHELKLLVAAADYNIAYLHYLRGEYLVAKRLYGVSREYCEDAGDRYHAALCDLDESELLLDLNLNDDGGHLARRAAAGFAVLGMPYERAKALVQLAIALSRRGLETGALRAFQAARRIFAAEKNGLWPALIDLELAILWRQRGGYAKTVRLCRRAYRTLAGSAMPGRAALCELLLGHLSMRRGELDAARRWRKRASARLEGSVTPVLHCHAHYLEGRIEERSANPQLAWVRYQQALESIEDIRSGLWSEDARISFLRDKLPVYESLLALLPRLPGRRDGEALRLIEKAKARSLSERVAGVAPARADGEKPDPQLRRERLDLHALYRQLENATLRRLPNAAALRERVRERERAYLRRLGESAGAAPDVRAGILPEEELVGAVPDGAALLNYFEIEGRLHVSLLQGGDVKTIPVGDAEAARHHLRLLQLQMSKHQLGPAYLPAYGHTWRAATEAHLRSLYETVFAPVAPHLNAQHLILSPHGFLHHLPFHALKRGERFLIDDFTMSYTPSASVFAHCRRRVAGEENRSLVMGASDELAPYIGAEAKLAAEHLPGARLLLGDEARQQVLVEEGSRYRYLHIATHGLFRADNPAFSYIRLGDARMTMLDLEELRLRAELVTLSGCGTGLSAVVGAGETIGLMRGLLTAGARSLLLSLWDVHDESALEFFRVFYGELGRGSGKAGALQTAARSLRQQFAHPFYWAPFILVGDFEGSGAEWRGTP
jgi:tetratricopeptide (TPR) repeat protein